MKKPRNYVQREIRVADNNGPTPERAAKPDYGSVVEGKKQSAANGASCLLLSGLGALMVQS